MSETSVDSPLGRLPLHDRHEAAGARFAPFAGWNMPVRYAQIKDEHMAVRQAAGVFDVSHMGEVFFRGPDAAAALDRIVTNHVGALTPGRAHYTVMCAPDGGIVDDLIIYCLGPQEYLVCVNAGNRHTDAAWLAEHATGDVNVVDESDAWAQLAVQGPAAIAIADRICDGDLAGMAAFGCARLTVAGVPCIVARTGYTGEDGVEIYIPAAQATVVWDALFAAGAAEGLQPIGLGARDSLRLEARLPLYGNDIDRSTNPIEAGLGWTVKFDKGDFVGRDALLAVKEAGPTRRFRGLVVDTPSVPRAGATVWVGDTQVGAITSGSLAYALGDARIATAYVDIAHADATEAEVLIRDRRFPAKVLKTPFYKRAR